MTGDGTADLFSIQDLTRWALSSSAVSGWEIINNGLLPADESEDYSYDVDHPDITGPELDPGATQHFPDMSFRAPGLGRYGEQEYAVTQAKLAEEQRAANPVVWWVIRILVKQAAGQVATHIPGGTVVRAESLELAEGEGP